MDEKGLTPHYEPQASQWAKLLPPEQQKKVAPAGAVTAAQAQAWIVRMVKAAAGQGDIGAIVAEFDQWKKRDMFVNPDSGATMNMMAAQLLARAKKFKEALQELDDALACKPTNENLRITLKQMRTQLDAVIHGGEVVAGLGTGFCIAKGGYVVTNHHVIANNKKVMVRLANEEKAVPATVIGDDEKGDMAMLRVELPPGMKLVAAPMIPGVAVGERVCALGYPDNGAMRDLAAKQKPSFTAGFVSTVPDLSNEEAFIQIDCRINHGNSGGPLCNKFGAVVGMVRAEEFHHRGPRQFRLRHSRRASQGVHSEEPPQGGRLQGEEAARGPDGMGRRHEADGAVGRLRAELPIRGKAHAPGRAPRGSASDAVAAFAPVME